MKQVRQLYFSILIFCVLCIQFFHRPASASYVDTNLNTFIHDAAEQQVGMVGQDMQLHVRIGYNGVNGLYNPATPEITNVRVRLSNDQNYLTVTETSPNHSPKKNPYEADSDDPEEAAAHDAYDEGWRAGIQRAYNASLGLTYPVDGGRYPFEVNASIFTQEQQFDVLQKGEYAEAVFNVTVRSDTEEGYYGIPLTIWYEVAQNPKGGGGQLLKTEFVNVYIESSGEVTDPSTSTRDHAFVIGEGQQTPQGAYPAPMAFSVKLRNQSGKALYDVVVHLEMQLSDTKEVQPTALAKRTADKSYPFEILEANYDRVYEVVEGDESILPDYTMAIKPNAASGFYPLRFVVSYKQTPTSTVTKTDSFDYFVRVQNQTMEDEDEELGEFNENDRVRARLVVDHFETIPEKVYAGIPFTLVLTMKNASASIPASNILFTLESAKVSDSAVFSMEGGANSVVVNALAAGQTAEIRMQMTAEAGVDPKSYAVTVSEKYDSPEYKNATEKVVLDIPVHQVARLSCSSFEVMPSSIEVGNESNVMFSINNTGKVILYNVEAAFAAESIKGTTSYVGNIKPGETGNVDVMLEGVSPTMDEGVVPVTIQYEDVNGVPYTEDAEISLYVTEPLDLDFSDFSDLNSMEPEGGIRGFLSGNGKWAVIGGGVVLLLILWAVVRMRKKKEEDADI